MISLVSEPAIVLHLEDKLEPEIFQQIIEIENAYISHLKVCQYSFFDF